MCLGIQACVNVDVHMWKCAHVYAYLCKCVCMHMCGYIASSNMDGWMNSVCERQFGRGGTS